MGMVTMLVMWHGHFEQMFVPSAGSSLWSAVTTGPVAFEVFEVVILSELWVKGQTTIDLLYS